MKTKLSVMFAAMLALGLAFTACDNGTTGGGTVKQPLLTGDIVSGSGLAAKLAWLETNAQSGGSYIIELNANESTAPVVLSYAGKTGVIIGLRGSGKRTVSLSSQGSMFTVGSGVSLILDKNITLTGLENNSDRSAVILVESGGKLVMNEGAVISGNHGNWGSGGVYVVGDFTMNGGTISGNILGMVLRGGFTMNGGAISGNTYDGVSAWWGPGYNEMAAWRDFTMNGGAISGNGQTGVWAMGDFTMNGGTISGSERGVISFSSFTMKGGAISGNKGGVHAHDFTMHDGNISGNGGFGVIVGGDGDSATFTMNGGNISGNATASTPEDWGAGVYMIIGTFIMNNGAISGNKGSGVFVSSEWGATAFTMNGGAITGNTATVFDNGESRGGGVFVQGVFNMKGGTISGNNAQYGGGVATAGNGTFTKTGGTITGSDSNNGNVARQSNGGHAVSAITWNVGAFDILKHRDTTSGPGDNLSFNGRTGAFSGAWDS